SLLRLLEGFEAQPLVAEEGLHALLPDGRAEIVARPVEAGDGDELRFQALTEDARRLVAVDAGQRPAAQAAIDMDATLGDELGARGDRADDDEIAAIRKDPLARAHGLADEQGRRRGLGGARGGNTAAVALRRHLAAALQRDEASAECRRVLPHAAVQNA